MIGNIGRRAAAGHIDARGIAVIQRHATEIDGEGRCLRRILIDTRRRGDTEHHRIGLGDVGDGGGLGAVDGGVHRAAQGRRDRLGAFHQRIVNRLHREREGRPDEGVVEGQRIARQGHTRGGRRRRAQAHQEVLVIGNIGRRAAAGHVHARGIARAEGHTAQVNREGRRLACIFINTRRRGDTEHHRIELDDVGAGRRPGGIDGAVDRNAQGRRHRLGAFNEGVIDSLHREVEGRADEELIKGQRVAGETHTRGRGRRRTHLSEEVLVVHRIGRRPAPGHVHARRLAHAQRCPVQVDLEVHRAGRLLPDSPRVRDNPEIHRRDRDADRQVRSELRGPAIRQLIINTHLARIVDLGRRGSDKISRAQRDAGKRDVREGCVAAAVCRDRRRPQVDARFAVGGVLGSSRVAEEFDAVLGAEPVGVERTAERQVCATEPG